MIRIKEAGMVLAAVLFGLTACNKTTTSSGATPAAKPAYEALANAILLSVQTIAPNAQSGSSARPRISGSGNLTAKCFGGGTVAAAASISGTGSADPYLITATAHETYASCKAGGYTWDGNLSEVFSANANLQPDPGGLPPASSTYTLTAFSVNGAITTDGTVNITGGSFGNSKSCPVIGFVVNFSSVGYNLATGKAQGSVTLGGSVCGTPVPPGTSFTF
jgi:hypothetical protein